MSYGSSDRYYSQRYKKFLDAILNQLPRYIEQYPASEQQYLTAFLQVLKGYKIDTQQARDFLSTQFQNFSKEYVSLEIYYRLPFLWFAVDYLDTANRLLSNTTFYGKNFYSYLVKHLRGDPNTFGAFSLIKNRTPLTDPKWEQLQNTCIKLQDPLSNEELTAIKNLYSSLLEYPGINILNINNIKNIIGTRIKNRKFIRQLARLFTRLDMKWIFHEYRPAFGLELMIFSFQLKNSISLSDIIDFQNPVNGITCTSSIYQIQQFPNMFHGRMTIPTAYVDNLISYFEECTHKGKIIINILEKVTETHLSNSLALYRPEKGWYNPSETQKRLLTQRLKIKKPRKKRSSISHFYLSPSFNQSWDYMKHSKPLEIIKLYCKEDRTFSYEDLMGSPNNLIEKRYTESDLNMLKELIQKNVIQIGFYSNSLLREFSSEYCWIQLPHMPFNQLVRLFEWLPQCFTLFTGKKIHLWTYLTSELMNWIRNDLKWPVFVINRFLPPQKRDFNQMFDSDRSTWKIPYFLRVQE